MPRKITEIDVRDIRFPTSRHLDGSDAMNAAPDYSAAYVILQTDGTETGHGLTFTIGRGTEICVAAVQALAPFVLDRDLSTIMADMGGFWRALTGDSQLRWIGPEKGAIHLGAAAIINAVWDLWAKCVKKPVWKLLVDMSPEELIGCLDFRYVTDALTPAEALTILRRSLPGRKVREQQIHESGYPAYTTSAGWLGYPEEKIRSLARLAVSQGWTHFKQKVGGDLAADIKRAQILREEIGWDRVLMMDANQVWEVNEAVAAMRQLAVFLPWWIEEPTSPDDILGHAQIRAHIKPIGVATGEHCHNRVMFKQFLQAEAIDFCQIDLARLGGLNEAILVVLMAAKYGIPVCPHGGGVGLCEYIQHIALFDYICVSASLEGRVLEYVDHLHEHFLDPVVIRDGHYVPPRAPGFSIEMRPDTLNEFEYPTGKAWCS